MSASELISEQLLDSPDTIDFSLIQHDLPSTEANVVEPIIALSDHTITYCPVRFAEVDNANHSNHSALTKFFGALVFSNAVSEVLSLTSIYLARMEAPDIIPQVLHGMSVGMGKNIAMSVSADSAKDYLKSSFEILTEYLPQPLAQFIAEETAVTLLHMGLNLLQDTKTCLKEKLIKTFYANCAETLLKKVGMALPEYPTRVTQTLFKRLFKDSSTCLLSSLTYLDDICPVKPRFFISDTLKGIIKDIAWAAPLATNPIGASVAGPTLLSICLKNTLVTMAKYAGETAYTWYGQESTEKLIDYYIPHESLLNLLAKKLATSSVPTFCLTLVNKAL